MNRQSTETVYRVEPWVIRPARTMDAAALCAYFAIIAGERPNNTSIRRHSLTLSTAAMRERIEQTLQDNAGALFVAVQAGNVVGYVSLSRPNDAFRAHIATLSVNVHPEWRGCGLGSALLDSALAWARSQPQIERVELEALTRNKGAIRLYRRHGFRVEGVFRNAYRLVDEGDGTTRASAVHMALSLEGQTRPATRLTAEFSAWNDQWN